VTAGTEETLSRQTKNIDFFSVRLCGIKTPENTDGVGTPTKGRPCTSYYSSARMFVDDIFHLRSTRSQGFRHFMGKSCIGTST
jgi:hypothetical protein